MNFGKRQLILSALILALGTAVYLNWQFSSNKELIDTNKIISTKELGEAKFVNNTVEGSSTDESEKKEEKPGEEQKEESKENASEYFSKTKAARQKARDEATDMIKEILEDVKSSEETKAEAIKQAAIVAKNIEQEANIESLVRAKGFKECLAFIQNDECSIVVGGGDLTESLAVSIKDIVSGQGGISADKIKIMQAK